MKSIKFVAGLVAGVAVLGAVSAHATAQAVLLNISVTTWQQTTTTNPAGVITYISTPVTLNSADLLAKMGTSLGITLPAGSKLGLSIISQNPDGVNPGDVVIMGADGSILWDVNNFNNTNGHADIRISFSPDVTQVTAAGAAYNSNVPQRRGPNGQTLTTTYNAKGFGQLHFNIYANPTEAVDGFVGCNGDFYDDVGSVVAVRSNSNTSSIRLVTGTLIFSGGGQFEHYDADNDFIQPANTTVSGAAANIPNGILGIFGGNF